VFEISKGIYETHSVSATGAVVAPAALAINTATLSSILMNGTEVLATLASVLLAAWVYQDAKKRRMDAFLWALSVLLIRLIGLAIYLIVRKKHSPKESIVPLPAESTVQTARKSFIKSQIVAIIIGPPFIVFSSLFIRFTAFIHPFLLLFIAPCFSFAGYYVCFWPTRALPLFFGYAFGPLAGFTIGFLSGIITDICIIGYGGPWWSLDISDGLEGLLMGLGAVILPERKRRESIGLLWCALLAVISSFAGMSFAAFTDRIIGHGLPPSRFIAFGIEDAITGAISTPLIAFIYYNIAYTASIEEVAGKPEKSMPVVSQLPPRGTKPITTRILDEEFLRAVEKGDIARVRELLEKGADAGAVDNRGWTPLHYAAFAGYVNIAALLIGWRANVNARDKDGITPLHVAAARGHSGVVELLVKSGADVNARSYSGRTPLHVAAGNGHVEVVRLLLESGADPSVKSLDGKTPLDLARESKRAEVVRCIEEFTRFRIERARALYEELVALRGEIEKYRGYLSKLEALHAEGNISDDAYQQLKREYMEKLKELERKMEALEKERRSEASRTHSALD
jgi:uncharacterized membrane protein